jgi:hypothetical protein
MSNQFEDDERFDGLYLNVAQTTQGIEPLLDTVFSFLRRKTDFFAGPPGVTDGTGAAIAKVNEVLEKHARRYQAEMEKKKKTTKLPPPKPKVAPKFEQPFKKKQEDEDDGEIIEMGTDGNFDISEDKPASKPVISPLKPAKTKEKEDTKPSPEEIAEKIQAKDGSDDDEADNGPPPVGNGGTVAGKYVWTQTLAEVMVTIPVPENTRGRDLTVTMARTHLKVALKTGTEKKMLVDAPLTKPIICDDSFWTVEDGNRLVVNLQKSNQMEWWESVCKGDPTIDVRKVNPENSSLSDLDGETRKTVEKMMVRAAFSCMMYGI